ncbi:MAG: VacJ family lipoprotein [Desulfobacterales bacterium]
MKKLISLVATLAFFIVLGDHTPADAFHEEDLIYLAQQTEASSDKQSETGTDEVSNETEAGEEEDDEYDDEYDEYEDEYADEEDVELIPDPLIGVNTGLYHFNDKLYFWLLKPVAQGYKFIIPMEFRTVIVNVFYNIRFPVRFINCLLQGKGQKAIKEAGSFFINSTIGILGMADAASHWPNLETSKEDLGQTFAVWGIGNGAYLTLPFLGPSSLRDGLGRVGDTFLDPIWWLFDDFWTSVGIRAGEAVNETSLRIGQYEALKEAALDPYVMLRNAYVQNRNKLIAE